MEHRKGGGYYMTSVRLDEQLETLLKEASRVTGEPVSKIIRSAIEAHCDSLLSGRLDHRLADVIGSVASGGGNSRKTGQAYLEALEARGKSRK
jgi:predicted DNA-binding protein